MAKSRSRRKDTRALRPPRAKKATRTKSESAAKASRVKKRAGTRAAKPSRQAKPGRVKPSARAKAPTPAPTPKTADEAAFLESLIVHGQAARARPDGTLPPGATHELVEDAQGDVRAVRRRFSGI